MEEIKKTDATKENIKDSKKKNSKLRMILVLIFIALFALITYISLRGSYLEYKELGENFVEVFFTNLT